MDPSVALNIAAIVISIFALGTSTWLAARQAILQERANHLPALITLISEFRSAEFHRRYDYVCTKLPAEHSNEHGVTGLPEPARDAFYDVAYYFQTAATLVMLGILDERETLVLLQRRVITLWDSIAPYVARERELNPSTGSLLSFLEAFAEKARALPSDTADQLRRWNRPIR